MSPAEPLEIWDYPRGEVLMPYPGGSYVLYNGCIVRCAVGTTNIEIVGEVAWEPGVFNALIFKVEAGYVYSVEAKASMAKISDERLGEYLFALTRAGKSRTFPVSSGFAIRGEAQLNEAYGTITQATVIAHLPSYARHQTVQAMRKVEVPTPDQASSSIAMTDLMTTQQFSPTPVRGFLEVLGKDDETIDVIAELDDPATDSETFDRPTRPALLPPPLATMPVSVIKVPALPAEIEVEYEPPSFVDDGRGREGPPTLRPDAVQTAA